MAFVTLGKGEILMTKTLINDEFLVFGVGLVVR